MRLFAKILVIAMVIWLLSVVICGLLGVSIQFPFTILEEGEIAYHRWQTIRIALFLTVAYYGLQYVLGFTKVTLGSFDDSAASRIGSLGAVSIHSGR